MIRRMRMKDLLLKKKAAVLLTTALFFISGCGYTTRSLLPSNFKTICVENFTNKVNVAAESNDDRMYRAYRPGMEINVAKAIRDKLVFDGNLKVTNSEDADLILKGELVDFRNEALRYDRNDNVMEYRIRVVVNIEMQTKDGKTRWKENNFAGEWLYTTTGPLARSEDSAIVDAEGDLARRVVERTVEEW
jgi:outer membrane lipopolysaccharide assembly protein LptE/RlpB